MARPTIFKPETATEICARIAEGDSLAAICRDDAMPGYRTVMTWLSSNLEFQQDYIRAREEQGNADADAVTDIARRTLAGEFEPQAARVAIDALKWTAGKRLPKKYGDKIEVDNNLNMSDPMMSMFERIAAQGKRLGSNDSND